MIQNYLGFYKEDGHILSLSVCFPSIQSPLSKNLSPSDKGFSVRGKDLNPKEVDPFKKGGKTILKKKKMNPLVVSLVS